VNDRPPSADRRQAFQTYLREQMRLTNSQRSHREARSELVEVPPAHPLRFDERGFPVAQPDRGGLSERIRRLLATPHYDRFHKTETP
jgi:hypothetical protein